MKSHNNVTSDFHDIDTLAGFEFSLEILNLSFRFSWKSLKRTNQTILQEARNKVYRTVNTEMLRAYWNIGKEIVEEEQKGKDRAAYGSALIKELSAKLTKEFGKGFTETNLKYMRQFYQAFEKGHALSDELSWTHYW